MRKLLIVTLAAMLLAPTLLYAGEEGGERRGGDRGRGGRGGDFRDRMRGFMDQVPADVRAILEKRRNNEDLTEEETAKMTKFRDGMRNRMQDAMRNRGGGDRGGFTRSRGPSNPLTREKLNPADTALQTIAEVRMKAQQFEEAIAVLQRMTKSPELAAKASAHLNIASIQRKQLGETEKALVEYQKVEGPLAPKAWQEILSLADEMGEFEKGIEILEGILEKTTDKAEKLKLLHLIAKGWGTHDQPDKSIETLERIVKLLPYGEATKMTELYSPNATDMMKLDNVQRIEMRERLRFLYLPYGETGRGR